MADLRGHAVRMRELMDHLAKSEGVFDYFYCDSRGLVTIAIGYLVDTVGGSQRAGQALVRKLGRRADVRFTKPNGAAATVADVVADWAKVKAHGQMHRNLRARTYGQVATLRIDRRSVRAITGTVIRRFLDQLYARRPFMLSYDTHVAMALVDVRYNPAGVSLYGSQMQIFWNSLDPSHSDFDPARAMGIFEHKWTGARLASRQPPYLLRHYQRVQWMRSGLLAMGGAEAPVSVP